MPSTKPAAHRGDEIPPEAWLEAYPPPLVEIAVRLRAIVRRTLPDAIERVRPGWGILGYDLPAGRRSVFFAWIWPQAQPRHTHVHLGFVHGVLMDDPDGRLEGAGVTRNARWVTVRPGEPIDEPRLVELLREAEGHALLPAPVRRALLRDRGAIQP